MSAEEIKAAIAFMNRVQLAGTEVPAWVAVMTRLQEMLTASSNQGQ